MCNKWTDFLCEEKFCKIEVCSIAEDQREFYENLIFADLLDRSLSSCFKEQADKQLVSFGKESKGWRAFVH